MKGREPAVLTQLHQACQEQWARRLTTHSERFGKGYPTCLTRVKQYRGKATKYPSSKWKAISTGDVRKEIRAATNRNYSDIQVNKTAISEELWQG